MREQVERPCRVDGWDAQFDVLLVRYVDGCAEVDRHDPTRNPRGPEKLGPHFADGPVRRPCYGYVSFPHTARGAAGSSLPACAVGGGRGRMWALAGSHSGRLRGRRWRTSLATAAS